MYLPRLLGPTLTRVMGQFPAVLVTGPRQSGKTTLLKKELAAPFDYVTFDDPLERRFALEDPNGFLTRFTAPTCVFDEIQYALELLQYLKIRIDRERERTGRFVLTGSQRPGLMRDAGESLAGRVAVLDLLPLSLEELWPGTGPLSAEESVWRGGYPEPALHPDMRDVWLSSYIQTYVERDVRQLRNVADLRAFTSFVALCAARHGNECVLASLSRDAGVSLPTVKAWLSLLEASGLARLLPPYHENFGKRLVKTHKLYFQDSALVCALTRQPDAASALAGPAGGALFEGLVVMEAVKRLSAAGRPADLFFWRSHDGIEVDLILSLEGRLHPVEIKLTATPMPGHAGPLQAFARLAGESRIGEKLLVCRVPEPRLLPGGVTALPFADWGGFIGSRLA